MHLQRIYTENGEFCEFNYSKVWQDTLQSTLEFMREKLKMYKIAIRIDELCAMGDSIFIMVQYTIKSFKRWSSCCGIDANALIRQPPLPGIICPDY